MVSPSKKKKTDCKGRENGLLQKQSSRKAKSYKPLSSKKFYLDIKNHASVTKLEKKLKFLGATIELFLIKEVDYVVSDRKVSKVTTKADTPGTASPSPSPSPAFLSSPADGGVPKKSRSRAEAMLERVRLQPKHIAVDPLDNARNWNIPIYSLEVFLQRLDKLCAKALACTSRSKKPISHSDVKVLKGSYLKIETGARPEFRELQEWPTINFNTSVGESPFCLPRYKNGGIRRVTRKLGKNCDDSDKPVGGFCELCRIDYTSLKSHLVSDQHEKLSKSNVFMQLDSLIKTKNVDAFIAAQMCPSLVGTRRSLRSGSVEIGPAMGMRLSSTPQATSPASPVSPSLPNGQILSRTRSSTLHMRQSLDDNFSKKPLEVQCNGVINHCHYTRYAVKSDSALSKDVQEDGITKRTRTFSASCPGTAREFSQLSPTGSDITHHLRSRKHIFLPSNLLGTTAEDALRSKIRDSTTETRMQLPAKQEASSPTKSIKQPSPLSSNLKNCKVNNSGKIAKVSSSKKKKISRKRLNPEEKLLEDNKAYYKVEVLNTKLRSTGYYLSQRELELSKINGMDSSIVENCIVKDEPKPEEKEPVVVRFQKIRKTELSLLSDEAENFMFGETARKESSEESSEDEDDGEDDTSTGPESEENKKSIKVKIKKEDIQDENSMGSCSLASSCSSYKRRRPTQAEAFIRDNLDYYKFDLSASRLRYQGSILPHISEPKEVLKSEDNKEICKTSDEKINKDEVLSEGEDEEGHVDENLDQITFSFEGIPESETWYKTYKRQDNCEEFYYKSYYEYPNIVLPYQMPNAMRQSLFNSDKSFVRKRQSRLPALDDKPRKSPRCHASTLAIMSSLLRRKVKDPSPIAQPVQTEVACSEVCSINEESRSSIPDTPVSVVTAEPKVESKSETKQNSKQLVKVINNAIESVYVEGEDDKYAQTLKSLLKELGSDKEMDSPSSKRGKVKSSRLSNAKRECSESDMCLPVDPNVLIEVGNVHTNCPPGPIVEVMSLLDNFKYCTSMERADYEHMNPRAVDVLRALTIDASCNSSDCGASSTCEGLSFLDDSRSCRRKKRKKRNMTGWPLGRPRRKIMKKCDESPLSKTEEKTEISSAGKSDKITSEPICDLSESKDSEPEVTKVVSTRFSSISRTVSCDSSVKSEIQECCIKLQKLSESSTKDGVVFLKKSKSSDSLQLTSPNKSSPKRNILRRRSSAKWGNYSVRKYR